MGDESRFESVSKFIAGTGVAAAATLFTATGFLATRSYLAALGVPEHAALSTTDYLQYGGRIFFVLAAQLALMAVLALLLGIPLLRFRRLLHTGSLTSILVIVLAAISTYVEFGLLNIEPIFSVGRTGSVAPASKLQLLLVELLTALTVTILVRFATNLWHDSQSNAARESIALGSMLAVSVQVLLLPLCFGRVAMVPRSFDVVSLIRDKDQPPLQGTLVFSDSTSHFVFVAEKQLVEVPRVNVKEIRYVGRASLRELVP